MSGPFGSSQWMYSSGGFYPDEIEQSLRFNDDDSAYLSWTPASAGNRKTWTWSGWVKRGNINNNFQPFFASGTTVANRFYAFFLNNDNGQSIRLFSKLSSTTNLQIDTQASFRDVSAWYHILISIDTTQASASSRVKIYVNGVEQSLTTTTAPPQDTVFEVNQTSSHRIGNVGWESSSKFDGYLAEVNFIDGQALDPTSFGEFKSGVWVANEYTGSYGTNGFYLPFKQTTVANGMNTVLYTGNGSTQSIEGVGFSPDLVWLKNRSSSFSHNIYDTVRGTNSILFSDTTASEDTITTDRLQSFDADGFTLGSASAINGSGNDLVAWAWDAGSGSPVSNTDGSITSSVKANPAYGFSVVSYTGTGSNATVGHGLSSAPDMMIIKERNSAANWIVYHQSLTADKFMILNLTNAEADFTPIFNDTEPTSSVFTVGTNGDINGSADQYIAYCFAEISGYSKISSYSGTGASGNTVTTGFEPAFVMLKRTDNTGTWLMYDNVRDTTNPRSYYLYANQSDAEAGPDNLMQFDDNGFTLLGGNADWNASGGTYIYMAFADTRDAAFWRDLSGNDNTWQPNALQNSDVMLDSPTNNFAVWNPLSNNTGGSLSEGNLRVSTGSSQYGPAPSTFAQSSGKWYAEFAATSTSGDTRIGAVRTDVALSTTYDLGNSGSFAYRQNDGQKKIDGSQSSYGATWAASDIIGMALDLDNSEVTFYKNNVSQGTFSITAGEYFIALSDGDSGAGGNYLINFGQDSSFAGNKTAQGNTDDNGVGDFYYAPPAGYLALCTANLPDPVIDPAQDDVPSDYFNTVLYSGNSSTQSITGVGFQPDFAWIKNRNFTYTHGLFDAVRGGDKVLQSSATSAESTNANYITSFDADGFSMGNNPVTNESSRTYVAWNWLAGNGTSSNTDGSITSTVSVNQKAGFSVVGYTGTGVTTETVGHGLGAVPAMVIVKNRDTSTNNGHWVTYHQSLAANTQLALNLNIGAAASSAYFGGGVNTSPTSSVFSFANGSSNQGNVNETGDNYIAYCFAEVEGYSKFGSYIGNGSTDGPFVYCGFRPAWVTIKRTDASENWFTLDAKRDTDNGVFNYLRPNTSDADAPAGTPIFDFTANGFKLRNGAGPYNASGGTYIFMAFAEMPFRYSNAR